MVKPNAAAKKATHRIKRIFHEANLVGNEPVVATWQRRDDLVAIEIQKVIDAAREGKP